MPVIPPGVKPIDRAEEAAPRNLRQRLGDAWAALQGRPFGPGQPIQPTTSPAGDIPPRQFQYPTAVNLNRQPRREYKELTPFEQLRNLAALYDVAAMCIAARIEEMQGLDWSIAPNDKRQKSVYQDECNAVQAFFERPDRLNDYYAWTSMLLYELFSTDAMTLYVRKDQGGRLYSLEPVDGATIKPVLDERGRTVAYQQIVYGMAESNFRRSDDDAQVAGEFSPQEMLYKPRWTRVFTPYGSPPTEWIIIRVNTALRKQSFDLAWFTDGNIPDMVATAPDGNINPDQMSQFEDWFNSVLQGDDAARRKVHFIPWNMAFQALKEFQYNTAVDDWMLRVTCAAYSVPPQELGFTNDVNKATADMQEAVNERRGLKPLANWLKRAVYDPIIHQEFGEAVSPTQTISLPGGPTRPPINPFLGIGWQWYFGDNVDDLVRAQIHQIDISQGVISPDESRVIRYGDELTGKAPGPAQQIPGLLGPGLGGQPNTQPPKPINILTQAARAEMRQWREKAIRAARKGRPPGDEPFIVQSLPPSVQLAVRAGLTKAASEQDVRQVFEQAAVGEAATPDFFRPVHSRDYPDWSQYG